MSNWEAYDEEVIEKKKKTGRVSMPFMFSFKAMNAVLSKIEDETDEWDNQYPKNEFIKLWVNLMVIFAVLVMCSNMLFCVATVPFMFFYFFVLFQLFRAWKQFGYNKLMIVGMTIVTFILEVVIAYFVQGFIFG